MTILFSRILPGGTSSLPGNTVDYYFFIISTRLLVEIDSTVETATPS